MGYLEGMFGDPSLTQIQGKSLKKLDKKIALEIGSEILQTKRNDLYKLKLKD